MTVLAKSKPKKKSLFPSEEELGFRPFISPDSKIAPLKQVFAGYEIERRQILLTLEEDHTKRKNALTIYDEVLRDGVQIDQGYIKDIPTAAQVLQELGINLNEFKPNTIRFRKFGPGFAEKEISPFKYILTLKDRKESKKREVEFKLSREQFQKYWAYTEGSRLVKKRLKKKIKGHLFEIDAFMDRVLLIAECEVDHESKMAMVPTLGMEVTNNKLWTNKTLSR
jgi:CYTH domain-containing protein